MLSLFFMFGFSLVMIGCSDSDSSSTPTIASTVPNILFVVMDDVGIDQMSIFGYDGDNQPTLPNINAVANGGIRFRNTWSMPECSPGRAAMFTGRYPLRTGNGAALGEDDLANSQVTSFEMALPALLKQEADYTSGLFGKFHLGGPENNQFNNAAPFSLGWDYFFGNVGFVGPGSIDTTAGGIAAKNTYNCGYVPGPFHGGAASGACYFVDNTCKSISSGGALLEDSAGLHCITQGGIFQPDQICQASTPADVQDGFENVNAYYADEFVINDSTGAVTVLPPSDKRVRGYRTTLEADAAISWINSQAPDRPWMATVSFSAAHTPLQQAPAALTPSTRTSGDGLQCNNALDVRILQNQMTEAMDTEFGRILIETGLAARNSDGTLDYTPEASNTMIVIVGDNGTLGPSVKLPFNPLRAKGTAYQTGVWVPMIAAGPLVAEPNRDVEHMTNMVDVFKLFAEFAGVNADDVVPRTIDSAPLLAYLTNPGQQSIRTYNFTQTFQNLQADGTINPPCLITGACNHAAPTKSICEDNAGVWWGPGWDSTNASTILGTTVIGPGTIGSNSYGFSSDKGYPGVNGCAEVAKARDLSGQGPEFITLSHEAQAIRNDDYKYIINVVEHYDSDTKTVVPWPGIETEGLYAVNQSKSVFDLALNNVSSNLMRSEDSWSSDVQNAYTDLNQKLAEMMASQPDCVGDGNKNGVVDGEDLSIMEKISGIFGGSSTYDLDINGKNQVYVDSKLMDYGTCGASSTFY